MDTLFKFAFVNFRVFTNLFLSYTSMLMKIALKAIEWRSINDKSLVLGQDSCYHALGNLIALLSQFRAVCMSDLWLWSPRKYQDRLFSKRADLAVAVVTGADRNVGKETAISLATMGVKVIMGVSSIEDGQKIIDELKLVNEAAGNEVRALPLDLSSLKSVREFAAQVSKMEPTIDLLVNSGERLVGKLTITDEGFEKQFVENYLGHYLLTRLLMNNLQAAPNGRVINVSDMLHHIGTIDFADLTLSKDYNLYLAYARSKLAQVLFTRELADRVRDTPVTVYALNTNTWRQWRPFPEDDWRRVFNDWFAKISDPINGSQTILYLAFEESLKKETGYYYSNCERISYVSNKTDELSSKLWEISEEMVGIVPTIAPTLAPKVVPETTITEVIPEDNPIESFLN